MADSVQFHLEKMLPEIEDLEKRGIFNAAEIKSIIRKRTAFEYAIHKRVSVKSDFLGYIEYEINLNRLRKTRKARLGLDQPPKKAKNGKKQVSLSDHSLVTRIHGLYSKALKKFAGDILLWMQYFDWCKATKSSKALGSSYARAIQLHPTDDRLWISCAKYEFEENLNISSARVLLQRGLRINPSSKTLWLEYFRLEMLWIQKIKQRRKILFNEGESSGDGVVIPSLEIEDSKTAMKFDMGNVPESNSSEAFEKALVQLIIPRAVVRNALKAVPEDLEFRKSFISLYEKFQAREHEATEEIYSGISTDFHDFESSSFICQRFVQGISRDDPIFPQRLKQTISAFEKMLNSSHSSEFLSCYVSFLTSTKTDCKDVYLKEYLSIILSRVYELGSSLNILSPDHYIDWARMSENDLDIIEKGLALFKNNSSLWLLKIEASNLAEVISIYKECLSCIHGIGSYPVWTSYLDHLIKIGSESVSAEFMASLSPVYLDGTCFEFNIIEKYLNWAMSIGIAQVREITASLLTIKIRDSNFYKLAISLELKSESDSSFICRLYDQCIQYSNSDTDMWLEYIKYKISIGDITGAVHLASKAKRELSDQDHFMTEFEELKKKI